MAAAIDVESHTLVLKMEQGDVFAGRFYSIEDNELKFLAGRIIWVRGRLAGMFFKQALHPRAMDRLRSGMSAVDQSDCLVLAPVSPGPSQNSEMDG